MSERRVMHVNSWILINSWNFASKNPASEFYGTEIIFQTKNFTWDYLTKIFIKSQIELIKDKGKSVLIFWDKLNCNTRSMLELIFLQPGHCQCTKLTPITLHRRIVCEKRQLDTSALLSSKILKRFLFRLNLRLDNANSLDYNCIYKHLGDRVLTVSDLHHGYCCDQ